MNGIARLSVQADLGHRGGLDLRGAPPFPPAGTFAALGGRETVARIVAGLYDRIEADTLLRPAFHRDLTAERESVTRFFEAWLGGASAYFDREWSRPGLKATHAGISISRGMAGRWVGHFLDACADAVADPEVVRGIKPSISRLAMALVNRPNEPAAGEALRAGCRNVDDAFLRAVQRDDPANVAAVANAHPEALSRHGAKYLLIAAVRGKARAAAQLLDLGVDANAATVLPGSEASVHELPLLPITPLCGALARNRAAVVGLLVEHGAQYDLFTAACVGDLDAVRELLDRAPELADVRDPASDVAPITPLVHAVFAGQFAVAQLLLERGARVDANPARMVRSAANRGDEALTDLLLAHGADPAAIGAGAWAQYPVLADRLVARGADVNRVPGAWIGLCCTGNSGHKENIALVRGMLRCGADVAARYKGRTALHCAAKAGFVHAVEALIEAGAEINALDDFGTTPLDAIGSAGASIDRAPVQRLLIAHGATVAKTTR